MRPEVVNKILHQTREIYNQIAPDFSNTRSNWWQGFGDFAKYVKAGDKVLDLGCGNGRLVTVFTDSRVSYFGVDGSQELIKIAQARFGDTSEIKFEVGDVTRLQLKENNFNLVFLIAVLHHIPTKELRLKILKDINNLMAVGGRLILYNWNLWQLGQKKNYWPYLWNYKNKIKRGVWGIGDAFVPWKMSGGGHPRYVHSFSARELKKLLVKAGFMIEDIHYECLGVRSGFWHGRNLVAVAVKK